MKNKPFVLRRVRSIRLEGFKRLSLFLLLFFPFSLSAKKYDPLKSVDVVRINSTTQKLVNQHTILFDGNVEVVIDEKLRLWAEHVHVDKEKEQLTAYADEGGFVVVESDAFLLSTEKFSLDIKEQTGSAQNVKVHFKDAFIEAEHIQKFPEYVWELKGITYTPCDSKSPHWSLQAGKARMYGNYLIKASHVRFVAGVIPLLQMPTFVIPLQNRSKSGFLFPKFSYDQEFGLGYRQEFYLKIADRCDTTLGLAWKERRGVVVSNEFRWAREPESFTLLNGQYAQEKNAFVKREDSIKKGTKKSYWVDGHNYHEFKLGALPVQSLTRADFGTDKRIGYHFYNTTEHVDNYFYNALSFRSTKDKATFFLSASTEKITRDQFSELTEQQLEEFAPVQPVKDRNAVPGIQETEDKFTLNRLPRFDFNSIFFNLGAGIYTKHDLFCDWVFAREQSTQQLFVNKQLRKQEDVRALEKIDTARFLYRITIDKQVEFRKNFFRVFVLPELQLRTRIKDGSNASSRNRIEGTLWDQRARYRFLIQAGAEWVMPEVCFSSESRWFQHYLQPFLRWETIPRFKQDHWYFVDKHDRHFAKNELQFALRSNLLFGDASLDFFLKQGYEFDQSDSIFPLRRGVELPHLLPFVWNTEFNYKGLQIFLGQEIEWKDWRLLQLDIHASYFFKHGDVRIGCVYQDMKAQKVRELYSDIPLFLMLGVNIPIGEHFRLKYDGHFYARGKSWRSAGSAIRPLLHRTYLEYQGHCWGMLAGFEEKRYRQQGNWRNEWAVVLSFSLDTLGSFAGRLHRPWF